MRDLAALAILFSVALASFGCTGDGGGGGGTGVRGAVTAGLSRNPSFGDSFGGSAIFIGQSIPIPDFDRPDGYCEDTSGDGLSGNVTFKDVGETVTITTGAGDLVMGQFLPGVYFGDGGDPSLWAMGATVSLVTPGGAVDAFTRDFPLSGAFTLTSPDPAVDATIDRAAGMTLAWTSSGATDPIFVNIEQYDFDTDETVFELTCQFDDDGSATIAASDLADMSTDPNLDTSIAITKERLTFIEDIPGIGTIVADGQVNYNVYVDAVQ